MTAHTVYTCILPILVDEGLPITITVDTQAHARSLVSYAGTRTRYYSFT